MNYFLRYFTSKYSDYKDFPCALGKHTKKMMTVCRKLCHSRQSEFQLQKELEFSCSQQVKVAMVAFGWLNYKGDWQTCGTTETGSSSPRWQVRNHKKFNYFFQFPSI